MIDYAIIRLELIAVVPFSMHFRKWRLLGSAVVALLVLALVVVPERVLARTTGDPPQSSKKKTTGDDSGPLLAVVSLAKQHIWIYGGTGLVAQSAVSTGTAGHRTPTGVFTVIQKRRYHRSNIYSNAPMPYMQRITWSGVALHAGVVPGYPASHGCIRLPQQFAVELWGMTKVGTRVVVVPDDATVSDLQHSRLPAPSLTPAPQEVGRQSEKESAEAYLSELSSAQPPASSKLTPPRTGFLNPAQRAKAAKAFAIADAGAKAKAAKIAVEASAVKAAAASKAMPALRAAEGALAAARRQRDAAVRAMEQTTAPKAAEHTKTALATAEADLAEAQRTTDDARLVEAMLTEEALAAARAASDAESAYRDAAAALKVADRGTEPISIFVSKKAGRVYIRQAWTPIHEAPVTFKEAGLPMGTHVYLAMGPEGDGETMRWLSLSLPPSALAQPRPSVGRDAPEPRASPPAPGSEHQRETAAGVLSRFELSEATIRFIEERLWTGAWLIVSDHGISGETGTFTDFIVLTR